VNPAKIKLVWISRTACQPEGPNKYINGCLELLSFKMVLAIANYFWFYT
jgi:hypothetical protein